MSIETIGSYVSKESTLYFKATNQRVTDDPETFAGLPVSLQIIGRRFEDEKVVAVLEYLKQTIGLPFVDFP